jgi:small subunit ribosomal protein S18
MAFRGSRSKSRKFRGFGRGRARRRDVEVDYKDVGTLQKFLSQYGKIHSRQRTGLSARRQRQLKAHIKYARFLALLPYK